MHFQQFSSKKVCNLIYRNGAETTVGMTSCMLKLCQILLIQTRPHVCLRSMFDKSRIMNYCRIIKSNLFSLIDSFIIVTCFQFTSPTPPSFSFVSDSNWSSVERFQSMDLPQKPSHQQSSSTLQRKAIFVEIFISYFQKRSLITVRWSRDLKCNNNSLTIKHQISKSEEKKRWVRAK